MVLALSSPAAGSGLYRLGLLQPTPRRCTCRRWPPPSLRGSAPSGSSRRPAELTAPISPSGHHDFFAFDRPPRLSTVSTRGPLRPRDPDRACSDNCTRTRSAMRGTCRSSTRRPRPPSFHLWHASRSRRRDSLWLLHQPCPRAGVRAVAATAGRDVRIRALALLVVLGIVPAYQTFTEGQWSFVILFGCLGAWSRRRRGHPTLAGMALVRLLAEAAPARPRPHLVAGGPALACRCGRDRTVIAVTAVALPPGSASWPIQLRQVPR